MSAQCVVIVVVFVIVVVILLCASTSHDISVTFTRSAHTIISKVRINFVRLLNIANLCLQTSTLSLVVGKTDRKIDSVAHILTNPDKRLFFLSREIVLALK